MPGTFRFSFGPWNIHEGADPFGPQVRKSIPFNKKLEDYKKLGFGAVQFHDDDAVPELDTMNAAQIQRKARSVRRQLDKHGLKAEFVAPRLWENPKTIDGGYTSNDPKSRKYAMKRNHITIDIANELGCDLVVLWLAREGTYIREAKDSVTATHRILDALNDMLEYDPNIRIAIEPKPNEPMDHTYIPTTGSALALGAHSIDPDRVGVNIESAHTILAGLDPSDEMGFALAFGKLFTVHLNDQNGLKFDQDKSFGAVDLRRALNQVRVLDRHDYGANGEWVGLDVKAMRSQKIDVATKHLSNSREVFLRLLEISRGIDDETVEGLIAERDYEELERVVLYALMGGAPKKRKK